MLPSAVGIPDLQLWESLAWLFLVYVAAIGTFGRYYHRAFLVDTNAFLFMQDIHNTQLQRARAEIGQAVQVAKERLATVQEVATALGEARFTERGGLQLASGKRLILKRSGVHGGDEVELPLAIDSVEVVAEGEDLGWAAREYELGEGDAERWMVNELRGMLEEHDNLVGRLTALQLTPHRVWTFWTFIYFSAMNQMTAGYGDIIPNSRPVRFAVVLQTLVGYLLLVFVLALVTAG